MNPDEKITWPQLIAEFVIFFRTRMIKNYPKVSKGKGWSSQIQKQVRDLNQQATVICNYFPHPDDEPLVVYAVKKYFREHKPLKIGQFRKARLSSKGGKEHLTITQAEKDVVLGINAELMKVIKSREQFNSIKIQPEDDRKPRTFDAQHNRHKRGNLTYLLEMEKELKAKQAVQE
jgi:hypothetical protein